jgi:hypothetical protein
MLTGSGRDMEGERRDTEAGRRGQVREEGGYAKG